MSEEQAERVFEAIRFSQTGGEPSCVWCGTSAAYRITRKVTCRKSGKVTPRRIFKCQKCLKQFSITSGTLFHGRKLSFVDILLTILLFANGAAGTAALRARRDLRCNHKTAWLNFKKLREGMTSFATGRILEGEVEMDSTEIGGTIRKANRAVDRKTQPRRDLSKVTKLSMLRERGGSGRLMPFLGDERAVTSAIKSLVKPGTTLFVDEHPAWNALFANYNVRMIRHKDQYSDGKGTSTNLVESTWARFKHMYRGTYRTFSQHYAPLYTGECSWREEHRRVSNGDQVILLAAEALHHPSSKLFRGYYQRTKRRSAA